MCAIYTANVTMKDISLGKDPTEDYIEGMMNEAPGPINFTMFLTTFGERLIKQGSAMSKGKKQNGKFFFYSQILNATFATRNLLTGRTEIAM